MVRLRVNLSNCLCTAKNRKLGSCGTELSSHSIAKEQEDTVLEEKEARCTHHDSVEASSDKEIMSDRDINRECRQEAYVRESIEHAKQNSMNYLCDSVEKEGSEFQRMRQDGGLSSHSDQNGDYYAGINVTELGSFSVSDSLQSADISQPMVQCIGVVDGADCFDIFRNLRMAKNGPNSKLATRESLNESLASYVGGCTSDTRDFVSRSPIPVRESLLSSRTVGPSSDLQNLLPLHPGFSLSDVGEYSEADKMELLRTVYELKAQLSRTTRLPTRGVDGSFNPINYDHHFRPENRTFEDPNYPTINQAKVCAEVKAHGSCSCSRLLLQPVAGAAPFTVCYRCLTLLRLPEDFMMLKKRRQKLRCNACRKVMSLSLLKGTHMVRSHTDGLTPPASDSARLRNTVGASHSGSRRDASFGKCSSTNGGASALENKSVVKTTGSLGASFKIPQWRKSSSEIKPSSSSRLYHLMGYSSPSRVLD